MKKRENLRSLPSQAALGSGVPGCSVFFSTPFKIFLFIFYTQYPGILVVFGGRSREKYATSPSWKQNSFHYFWSYKLNFFKTIKYYIFGKGFFLLIIGEIGILLRFSYPFSAQWAIIVCVCVCIQANSSKITLVSKLNLTFIDLIQQEIHVRQQEREHGPCLVVCGISIKKFMLTKSFSC